MFCDVILYILYIIFFENVVCDNVLWLCQTILIYIETIETYCASCIKDLQTKISLLGKQNKIS